MEGTLERGPSNGPDGATVVLAQHASYGSGCDTQEQDGDVPPHEEQQRHEPPTLLAFPDSSIVGAHDSPNAKLRRRLEETSQELYSNIAELQAGKLAADANPTEEQVELGRHLSKLNRVMQTEIRRRTQAMVQEGGPTMVSEEVV
eukprot:g17958.t1